MDKSKEGGISKTIEVMRELIDAVPESMIPMFKTSEMRCYVGKTVYEELLKEYPVKEGYDFIEIEGVKVTMFNA